MLTRCSVDELLDLTCVCPAVVCMYVPCCHVLCVACASVGTRHALNATCTCGVSQWIPPGPFSGNPTARNLIGVSSKRSNLPVLLLRTSSMLTERLISSEQFMFPSSRGSCRHVSTRAPLPIDSCFTANAVAVPRPHPHRLQTHVLAQSFALSHYE